VKCAFSYTVKDIFVHVTEGLPFIKPNCLNLLLRLVMSWDTEGAPVMNWMRMSALHDKKVVAFYYQMRFLGHAEGKRYRALEEVSKRNCQAYYLFFIYV